MLLTAGVFYSTPAARVRGVQVRFWRGRFYPIRSSVMAKRHITWVIAFALIAPAARGEENLAERRAVRGVPVDDGVGESPELRELRRFEEQAFPRGGVRRGAPSPDGALPPPLPGSWGGSGDVPPELRAAEPSDSALPRHPARLRVAAFPEAPRGPRALGAAGASLPGLLQERHQGARRHGELAAPRRPVSRSVRRRVRASGAASRSDLRRDGRERLRQLGPLARRRGRHLAVHAGGGAGLRARGELLGRRPTGSRTRGGGRRALSEGPLRPVRVLAPGVRRLQRRLRRRAAVDHQLQHQRLLGADSPRVGAPLGVERLRPQDPRGDDRRAEPGGVRVRRPDARRAVRVRRGRDAAPGPRWRRWRAPPERRSRSSRR